MPCTVTYNGKEYSEAEFFAFLANGGLEQLIKDGVYEPKRDIGGIEPPKGGKTDTGKQPPKEKTLVKKRAYEGKIREGVKKQLEEIGLTRDVDNLEQAQQRAKEIVLRIGEDMALEAVRMNDIEGATAAFIWNAAIESVNNKLAVETSPDEIERLEKLQADLLEEWGQKQWKSGAFNSAMQKILVESDFGYNAQKKIQEYKDQNGGKIPVEVEAKFRALDKELQELNKRLSEAEERAKKAEETQAITNIQESIAREGGSKDQRVKKAAKKLADKIRSGRAHKTINFSGGTPASLVWDAAIESVAAKIEAGAIADAVLSGLKLIRESDWYKGLNTEKRDAAESEFTEYVNSQIESTDGEIKIPHSMIREYVERGIDNIEELTSAVISDMGLDDTLETRRQVRDAITNYGKIANPNMEEIEVKIRKMKRIGRIISAMEDVAAKKRPLRSGIQRDKLDAEERALNKELRDAMKDLPIDEETQSNELKTRLDAAKQRVKNRIEDLQEAINKQEKISKEKTLLEKDEELKALEKERDEVQQMYEDIFGEKPLSEGQKKINALQKSLDKILFNGGDLSKPKPSFTKSEQAQIDDLKEQIYQAKKDAGMFASKRTEEQIKHDAIDKKIQETEKKIAENDLDLKKSEKKSETLAIQAKQSQLKETLKTLNDLRKDAGIIEKMRLEQAKKRTQKSIEDLQEKLKKGDFSKKKRTPVIADTELTKLQAEKLRVKEEFDKEFYINELRNRTKAQKFKDVLWELWSIPRVLMATGEASFIGIQGLKQTIAHPLNAVQAFRNAVKFFASEKKTEEWIRSIKSQEWYPIAKEAKLAISEPNVKLTAREELFYSGWSNLIWDMIGKAITSPMALKNKEAYKSAQEKWSRLNPIKALERAAVGYLDTLRIERFLDGMQILDKKKELGDAITIQDYKDVADAINTMTGRGSLGKLGEQNAEVLSKIFFSPRNWAAGIKTATPYALYHFGKMTPTARKMAIADMSKMLGVTTAFVMLAASYLNNDDDEETGVEFDARSTDFMKIKIGNIRIDVFGGMLQQIIFSTRIIADALMKFTPSLGIEGAIKKSDGQLYPLGVPYKTKSAQQLALQQAVNKLNPTASIINNYLNTRYKKDKQTGKSTLVTEYGKEYTVESELSDKFNPIFWNTVGELLKDDPTALDGLLVFYAFFGGGVQVYDDENKKEKSSQ